MYPTMDLTVQYKADLALTTQFFSRPVDQT